MVKGNTYPKMGLGLTFKFKVLPKKNDNPVLFEKSSVHVYAQQQKLIEDRYYGLSDQVRDSVEIDNGGINCNLSVESGLKCRVPSSSGNDARPFKTMWSSSDDPIIEMTHLAYNGLYALTKSGQLLFIAQWKGEVVPPKRLHEDLKFLPNRNGRYFINARSMKACLKTDEREIYCAEASALEHDSQIYGLINHNQPLLSRIEKSTFDVDEVAFGGRHFCFLSSEGEVWCKGDNGCGQITGRHDGKQVFDKLERIDFLKNKAQQVFAHAGGTCALLIDGSVQCWGLGASVIRTRILPDASYHHSFSWAHGFRPWRVCEGGAEKGI